jgi:hypothetical protein
MRFLSVNFSMTRIDTTHMIMVKQNKHMIRGGTIILLKRKKKARAIE